ncbi:nucleotidyltransferase domain-containing protein [Sulfurimonas sp. SWIR-19]|uniref:nucleotidyltransferase family protein n=1 Tax=Sulfurimonas sp. SWIR-19 TaxID=2878390 RepID=UPI001CF30128|nr:nucleotidyltransferase domain-containing protein [Sulfurimonas sp. SWIR-19]UCN00162.1 nucleotidyltransferase domain-containing protein [Sulfurimonas sp. SWIR-19]
MTKNEIITYLKEHKDDFMQKYQISKLALFGSYSRNENRDDSDVDIAIETPLSDYFKLYDFKEELENSFHTKVDIVRLRDKMNMALKRRIEKDGIYV